jgi:phosphoribosylglycinamide formyltransferase 1
MGKKPLNVTVLASGTGSTFEYLVQNLPPQLARVTALVVDRPEAGARERGIGLGVPVHLASSEAELLQVVGRLRADLYILAGYLRLIPRSVLEIVNGRMINVHPSLLPKFGGQGMYGRRVHEAVISAQEKFSGATVHWVAECYDTGQIILQQSFPLGPDESPLSLERRVKDLEKSLLVQAVTRLSGSAMPNQDQV